MAAWRLPLRIALRNLRSGAGGFRIFLVCLILGVAAIASVGSLSQAVERGLAEEGQPLLGGDLELSLVHRQVSDEQMRELSRHGAVSRVATLRAMASRAGERALVEVKAADDRYPLYGTLELAPATALADALELTNGRHGIAVDPLLMARLGAKVGDALRIGELEFDVRAAIRTEPDRVSDGFILGPRVLMSAAGLDATGLVKPGSLVTWRYRLKLDQPGQLQAVAERLKTLFPDAGWRVRLRDAAAPGVARYVERLTLFLTLVGLTSLIIGGLGVANAVKAFVDRRRRQTALLRYVGASPRMVFAAAFVEVMILALIGTAAGVVLGALLPALLIALFAGLLPVPVASGVFPWPLMSAAVFGLITAAAFALWPLGAIRNIAAVELIRGSPAGPGAWPGFGYAGLTGLAFGALAAWSFLTLDHPTMTGWYGLGVAASFLVLTGVGHLVVTLARRFPKPPHATVRFAIANLHRPGTATPAIVLSLGLGLAMFVMLSLVDRSVTRELTSSLPEDAPSFFFLDVDKSEKERFVAALKAEPSARAVTSAPMLRGRIVRVKGTPAERARPSADAAWALRGDRGLTYSDTLPAGSRLVAGQWWQAGYAGPPLVSLSRDIADGLGLVIGDEMTVNVLGREVSARIASLREVDWRSLGINFVMVFSPNALAAAPHSNLVTVNVAQDRQGDFLNRLGDAFPTVTAISVRDALDAVSNLLGKIVLAVRFANGLTLTSGVLVLAGALTTSLAARRYEAAVLKTFGATRAQLITVFAIEFLIAGIVTAVFAVIVGSIAAWALAYYILEIEFRFSFAVASLTALLAMIATLLAGLAATWSALAARPAALLRERSAGGRATYSHALGICLPLAAMVVLNRIYTRTGDKGTTALGTGKRLSKTHPRIEAYGSVDETNAAVGLARLHTGSLAELDAMLERIQNELFDVGADLCMPTARRGATTLRVSAGQAGRLESEIDLLNASLKPLRSFVLPGGHPAAAHLHHCRTVCRRAERRIVALAQRRGEKVGGEVLLYMNRLSDFLFVASRWVNARGGGDILWQPGKTQTP